MVNNTLFPKDSDLVINRFQILNDRDEHLAHLGLQVAHPKQWSTQKFKNIRT